MMDLLASDRFYVASYGTAAAYTGWLLRQFGADVEHATALDPEALGAFLGEGARFDARPALDPPPGVPVVTDVPVSAESREAVRALAARQPVTWITPWGSDGPWAERPWSDLVLHAAGGWMSAVGDPGKEPLGPPGAQGQFTAGLYAAIAALSSAASGSDAPPGLVDVSIHEAIVATMIYDSVGFQYFGRIRERVGNRFAATQPTLVTLPCKDGYIGLHCALHGQFVTLCALIGHPELVHDPRFASPADRALNVADLDTYLLPWFAERGRWEAYHELQAHRIPCSPLPDLAEVLASPQLAAREALRDVQTPSGRRYRVPASPARVLATASEDSAGRPSRPPRVVDLSMGWAGPMVGYVLACLGADVIKVESHTHFDWWRGSRPPGDDPSLGLHERSHVFNTTNRGKRGVSLNLSTPRGRELCLRLMDDADIIVENYGAGVLEKLGLTFDVVAARNPRAIMVRLPGFGSTGPEGHYLSFGNTIEGQSGLSSMIGYPGGPPFMMSNAFGDPIGGLNGAVAALAALRARDADGRGRLVECAQLEGFLPLVGEELIAYQASGQLPERRGNERRVSILSGVFQCAGEDQWLAIDVRTPGEMERLRRAALVSSDDPAEEREQLRAWIATMDRDALAETLATAGIPAAPVYNEAELLAVEPLLESDFWQGHERAVVGYHQYPGLPIRREGQRPELDVPAPTLGQHNAEVLSALGIEATEMEQLADEGVIGTVPAG